MYVRRCVAGMWDREGYVSASFFPLLSGSCHRFGAANLGSFTFGAVIPSQSCFGKVPPLAGVGFVRELPIMLRPWVHRVVSRMLSRRVQDVWFRLGRFPT